MPGTNPSKRSKEKSPSFWVTNDIDRYSMVLDSSNFHLKQSIPLLVGREMGYNLKSSFSRKITLLGKLNVKMTPSWVLRVFETARYHRLYT